MTVPGLRILLTNVQFGFRSGTEIVVRDFALGLQRRGHDVTVYAPKLEALAEETRALGIRVVDDLRLVPHTPDVIHAHHIGPTVEALARYPGVPAIWICHSSDGWIDTPPVFPQISRYCAVDELTRERLVSTPGIDPAQIVMMPNAVDLRRCPPRPVPLPVRPRRALVFGKSSDVAPLVEACCREAGIEFSAIGYGAGHVTPDPEPHLLQADIVFASARAAIEAIVAGAAVVVMDGRGLAGMATTGNAAYMRRNNFGLRTLVHPVSASAVAAAIAKYDSADAIAVSEGLRRDADLELILDRLEAMYRGAIVEAAAASDRSAATADALTGFFRDWLPGGSGEPRAWQGEHRRLSTIIAEQVRMIASLRAENHTLSEQQRASAAKAAATTTESMQLTARLAALQSENLALLADQHESAAAVSVEIAQWVARLELVQRSRPYRLGRWLRASRIGRLLP